MCTKELSGKAKEIKELLRLKEDLEREIVALQDEIKQEMSVRGTTELIAGEYKIRWQEVVTGRFDSKAFKEHYKDLYRRFTQQYKIKRFSII